MLEQGFVAEVEQLRANPLLSLDKPAMRTVGYRQIWRYLQGDYDYSEMQNRALYATRQLAKRQLTWLRKESDLSWFDSEHVTKGEVYSFINTKIGGG